MNKRRLHHFWRTFRHISPWYFLAVTVVLGTVAVIALRSNNQHMVVLRTAVYEADKNDGDVTKALNDLRLYVYSHMNTSLASSDGVYPPIQLKYTYDRLVKAESDHVAEANKQVYTAAQHYCEQQNSVDFSGHNRVPCIEAYVNTHGVKTHSIPDDLYKFDFVSPMWSPDLAGWSVVATILSLITFVILFIVRLWFKHNVA